MQKKWVKQYVPVLLGVLTLMVFPLAFHSYSGLAHFKFQTTIVLMNACLFTCIATWSYWKPHIRLLSLPRIMALALGIWITLSAFFGSEAGRQQDNGWPMTVMGFVRYEGLVSQLCYIAVFLAFSILPVRQGSRMVFSMAGVGVLVYLAIVICQYLDINILNLYPDQISIHTNYEFQGPLGNIDSGAGYICLILPLLIVSWVYGMGSFLLYGSGLAAALLLVLFDVQAGLLALMLLCVFLLCLALHSVMRRRRAFLALMGICFVFALKQCVSLPWLDGGESISLVLRPAAAVSAALGLVFLLLSYTKGTWHMSVRAIWLCLLALALAAYFVVLLVPMGSGALYEAHEILQGRGRDTYGSWRTGVWRHSLAMCGDHLLFGTGPDMFYYGFMDFLERNGLYIGEVFDNPHNLFLGILTTSGLPALLLFAGMLICIFRDLYRQRTVLAAVLGTALVVFLCQRMFSFSNCMVSPMFFAVLGMACSVGGGTEEVCEEAAAEGETRKTEADSRTDPDGR